MDKTVGYWLMSNSPITFFNIVTSQPVVARDGVTEPWLGVVEGLYWLK